MKALVALCALLLALIAFAVVPWLGALFLISGVLAAVGGGANAAGGLLGGLFGKPVSNARMFGWVLLGLGGPIFLGISVMLASKDDPHSNELALVPFVIAIISAGGGWLCLWLTKTKVAQSRSDDAIRPPSADSSEAQINRWREIFRQREEAKQKKRRKPSARTIAR